MAHVRVWVGFFELAPRLDALIGNDNDVGFIVNMLNRILELDLISFNRRHRQCGFVEAWGA